MTSLHLELYLTLGYNDSMSTKKKAASLLGKASAAARREKWGEEEFKRKMQQWGKLGGRPKKQSSEKASKYGTQKAR